MLIFKSFLRKKSTKIYILIFNILFIAIILLKGFYNNYLTMIRDDNSSSYIFFITSKEEIGKIKKFRDISKIVEEIYLNFDNKYFILNKDLSLKDNEIILPIYYSESYKVGEIINFYLNNNKDSLIVKDFSRDIFLTEMLVSSTYYEKIANLSVDKKYNIYLSNWLKEGKVLNKIRKEIRYNKDYSLNIFGKNIQDNVLIIVNTINIVLSIIILVLFIMAVVLIINLYTDEKVGNRMLISMGYNINKIATINILKFLIILLISSVFSCILFLVIAKLFKIVKIFLLLDYQFLLLITIVLMGLVFLYNFYFLKKYQRK